MPFPWKKTKGSRISQLVADRFNSSKHGGSLVVQTGFPTSIIDLFHKNRDRLKKSAKKKRSSRNPQECSTKLPSHEIELIAPERCSTDSEIELLNPEMELPSPERCSTNPIGDDLVSGKERVDEAVKDRNGNFIALLKVLFMVVLALLTKRLVVGVSVSAFSLFLLEYVGKYVYGLSKSCLDYQKMIKVIVERVLCFVRIKGVIDSDFQDSVNGLNLSVQLVEIEPELDTKVEPIIFVDSEKGLEFEKRELKNVDTEKKDESKQDGSRSARMKTKMSKLVGKKSCKSMRKGSGLKSVVLESTKKDTYIEKGQSKDVKQIGCDEEVCEDRVNILEISSDPFKLKLSNSEGSVVVAEARRETIWISKYWVICLIVLSGLVGGRFFAIVFTLTWCLILKPSGNKEDAHMSQSC